MEKPVRYLACAAALAALAACGGSTSVEHGRYSPTTLTFNANGTPDLKGLTIHLGNSAGDATIGDTVVYIVVQTLKQWGANADLQLGDANTTQLAVVSGQLQATAGPLPTDLNAGLDVFGNNQVHVDYLVVSRDLTSLDQIKGKTVAIATTVSPDYYLLQGALKKVGLTTSDVKVQLTGSNGNSVNDMIQGRVDLAFVHADALLQLEQHGTIHVLANAAALEPWEADSYMAATPAWLKANPATAEAIDLAWLHAAYVFDHERSAWVNAALAYTKNAETSSQVAAGYDALARAQPWPDDGSGMSLSTLTKNFDAARQAGQIKGRGDRPISQWADIGPWQAAVKYFKAHAKAIEA
ncbi:MAG TPA: PhnD/SsuA/transferrin family substrate-binding protein [Candidatus Dormibacteraeota bacterium]|nr:PhnD/SsuA/transferrin family substrate-binding protein [Candidatus Dormibacteraeota bacterium]